jgi:hypothetical protein
MVVWRGRETGAADPEFGDVVGWGQGWGGWWPKEEWVGRRCGAENEAKGEGGEVVY